MTRWRLAIAVFLLLLIVLPSALPFIDLFSHAHAWRAWAEADRFAALARNTLLLVAGTLALALPLGIGAAVLLYRTDLPCRGTLRFVTVLTLFVPLPLFTSAWQAALGTTGLFPVAGWRTPEIGAPWAQGLGAAVWVHAVAALPWVIVLVGQGLIWVERELEEDALCVFAAWRVLASVTLPRCRAAIAAAALWVALQTATEITVTDLMQVRTFAEEVYTQFTRPEPDPVLTDNRDVLARAVAVSLPAVLVTAALIVGAAVRWERDLPPLNTLSQPWRFHLGLARLPLLVLLLAAVAVLAGVPLISLIWKTGLHGSPAAWSAHVAAEHVVTVLRVRGGLVIESLLLAAGAGVLTTALALLVSWLAVGTRGFHAGVLLLMATAWALPGPVLGIGLKQAISRLLDMTDSEGLAIALYYGPSPLPVLWAYLLRFFPYAVALLWPVVRLLPRELRDAARVDGAGPGRELVHLVLPLTALPCVRAGLAVGVLALGELSAGKMVETPGSQTFAHMVFIDMHFGVTNDVAALCLVLLGAVLLGGSVFALFQSKYGKTAA